MKYVLKTSGALGKSVVVEEDFDFFMSTVESYVRSLPIYSKGVELTIFVAHDD